MLRKANETVRKSEEKVRQKEDEELPFSTSLKKTREWLRNAAPKLSKSLWKSTKKSTPTLDANPVLKPRGRPRKTPATRGGKLLKLRTRS